MADHTAHIGARYLTFALAAVGAAFSAALLFVVMTQPKLIEEKLKSFAISQVEEKAGDLISQAQVSDSGLLSGLANRFAQDELIAQTDLNAMIKTIVQRRCGKDCVQVSGTELLDSFELANRVIDFRIGQKTIAQHLLDRYDATVAGLVADLTTFGTANLIAFLTLIFLTIFRGQFGLRILPMTLLLMAYVSAAIYWYVFTQDWAAAILFNNWAAGGYVATMCIVYFLLIDFTFFYGRITEGIVNAIVTAIGNAAP